MFALIALKVRGIFTFKCIEFRRVSTLIALRFVAYLL
jgi:hypothetical protein